MPTRGWLVVSILLHVALIAALVRNPTEIYEGPSAGFGGPVGGGGGGGGPEVTYIAFAAPASPAAQEAVAVPIPREMRLPVPRVTAIRRDEPRVNAQLPTNARPIPMVRATGAGPGTGGDQGAGAGTGGGVGTGEGTGTGSGSGPGSGGDRGAVFPPTVRYTFLPPLPRPGSVQGHTFQVRFAVDAQGRVMDVEIDPRIADGGYRRKFVRTMLRFRFNPATLRDGTRVAGATVLSFTL